MSERSALLRELHHLSIQGIDCEWDGRADLAYHIQEARRQALVDRNILMFVESVRELEGHLLCTYCFTNGDEIVRQTRCRDIEWLAGEIIGDEIVHLRLIREDEGGDSACVNSQHDTAPQPMPVNVADAHISSHIKRRSNCHHCGGCQARHDYVSGFKDHLARVPLSPWAYRVAFGIAYYIDCADNCPEIHPHTCSANIPNAELARLAGLDSKDFVSAFTNVLHRARIIYKKPDGARGNLYTLNLKSEEWVLEAIPDSFKNTGEDTEKPSSTLADRLLIVAADKVTDRKFGAMVSDIVGPKAMAQLLTEEQMRDLISWLELRKDRHP